MSVKTIAVNTQVYKRLVANKREGESFPRMLDRLLQEVGDAHTGRAILRGLTAHASLSEADAQVFLGVIEENRAHEEWAAKAGALDR